MKCPRALYDTNTSLVGYEGEQPIDGITTLMERTVTTENDTEVVKGYIRDYWFPIYDIWCNETGVPDDRASRFLRMLVDLRYSEAKSIWPFMCKHKLWDYVDPNESVKIWKSILKSSSLSESNDGLLEEVAPVVGQVTQEVVVFAREMNRSNQVIHHLLSNSPALLSEGTSNKRAREE